MTKLMIKYEISLTPHKEKTLGKEKLKTAIQEK